MARSTMRSSRIVSSLAIAVGLFVVLDEQCPMLLAQVPVTTSITTVGPWIQTSMDIKNLFRITVGANRNDGSQSDATSLVIGGIEVTAGSTLDIAETVDNIIHVLDNNGNELTQIDLNNLQPGAIFSREFITVLGENLGLYTLLAERQALEVTNADGSVSSLPDPSQIQPGQTVNLASEGVNGLTPDTLVFSASPSNPNIVVVSRVSDFINPQLQVESADSAGARITPGTITVVQRMRTVENTSTTVLQSAQIITGENVSKLTRTVGGGVQQTTTVETRSTTRQVAGEMTMFVDAVEVTPAPDLTQTRRFRTEHEYKSSPIGTLVPLVVKKNATTPDGRPINGKLVVSDNPAQYKISDNIGLNIRGGVSRGEPQIGATVMVPLARKGTLSIGGNVTLNPGVSNTRGGVIVSGSGIIQVNEPLLVQSQRDQNGNALMNPKSGGVLYGQAIVTAALANTSTKTKVTTRTPQSDITAVRRNFTTATSTEFIDRETVEITRVDIEGIQTFEDTYSQPSSQTNIITDTSASVAIGSQTETETTQEFVDSTRENNIVTNAPVFGTPTTISSRSVQAGEVQIGTNQLVSTQQVSSTPSSFSETERSIERQSIQGQVVVGEPRETSVERGQTQRVASGASQVVRRQNEMQQEIVVDGTLRIGYSNIPNLGAVAKPGQVLYNLYGQLSTNKPDIGIGGLASVTLLDGVARNTAGEVQQGNGVTLNWDIIDIFLGADGVVYAGTFISIRGAGQSVDTDQVAINATASMNRYISTRNATNLNP